MGKAWNAEEIQADTQSDLQITVQGKQMEVGSALRIYAEEKLSDINSKFFNHATFATLTFSREGHGHGLIRAHILLQVGKNMRIMAEATEGEAYLSFDRAVEKAEQQLRRYKNRLRDHHERTDLNPADMTSAREHVLTDDLEDRTHSEGPAIIAEMTTNILTMSVSEAVMRMDLGGQPALMFRNASHDGLNMVYRRPDGNVGWIDPVGNEVIASSQTSLQNGKGKAHRA